MAIPTYDILLSKTVLHSHKDYEKALETFKHFRGFYETQADLPESAEEGDFAVVGETNTVWVYDGGDWLNSSVSAGVLSFNGRFGEVEPQSGDYTWNMIDNKPDSFPPSSHTHDMADITTGNLPIERLPIGGTWNFSDNLSLIGGDGKSLILEANNGADIQHRLSFTTIGLGSGVYLNYTNRFHLTSKISNKTIIRSYRLNEQDRLDLGVIPTIDGLTPTDDYHLVSKKYVEDNFVNKDYEEVLETFKHFRGFYSLSSELPVEAIAGDFAIVGETNTVWIYDGGWVDATGGVLSFNGRTGAVVPDIGDYSWGMIDDKPDSFPPSSHFHDMADIATGYLPMEQFPDHGVWIIGANKTVTIQKTDWTSVFKIDCPIEIGDGVDAGTIVGVNEIGDKKLLFGYANIPMPNMPTGGTWNLTSALTIAGAETRFSADCIFNYDNQDIDFTIRKLTSGVAYKYDAGTDIHTWYGATSDLVWDASAGVLSFSNSYVNLLMTLIDGNFIFNNLAQEIDFTIRKPISGNAMTYDAEYDYFNFGSRIRIPSGTKSSPSFVFADSPATGIYRSASNILGISTNGIPRLLIRSAFDSLGVFVFKEDTDQTVVLGGIESIINNSFAGVSNNARATIQNRAETTGNSGTRIGALNRAYSTTTTLNENQKLFGTYSDARVAGRGTNNVQIIGSYSRAEIGNSLSELGAANQDSELITGRNAFFGSVNLSIATGSTNSLNIGGFFRAANALENYAIYAQEGDAYIADDIIVDSDSWQYYGNKTTDGSWRFGRSGTDFVIERRESGNWVTKQTITA